MLSKFFKSRSKDPLWDRFVNATLVDPANSLVPRIQDAPEGRVYPVKADTSDPARTSQTVKELAQWLGADLVGIARLGATHTPTEDPAPADGSAGGEPESSESGGRRYPFAIVCAIASEYDPAQAKGFGGQQAVQKGAVVNHYLRAYIRELGFRASFGGADPLAVAAATGLGRLDESGRFVGRTNTPYTYVADVVATDLPLAVDATLHATLDQ